MEDNELDELMENVSAVSNGLTKPIYEKIDNYLKKYGLVRSHGLIIHALLHERELSMSELGQQLQVNKQNITALTDKLEKLKLVRRVSSQKDRRVSLIQLSEEGQKFGIEFKKELTKSLHNTFDKFSADDLALFKNTISTLKQLLSI